ncbi:hypothetical protein HQ531_02485 [bacterium]|nr:hypothetical protein [bacterium]
MSRILGEALPTVYHDGSEVTLPMPSFDGRDEQFIEENVREYVNLIKRLVRRSDGYRLGCRYVYAHISATDFQTLLSIARARTIQLKFATIPFGYHVWMVIEERGNAGGRLWSDRVVVRFRGKQLLPSYPDPDAMCSIPPYRGYGPIVTG